MGGYGWRVRVFRWKGRSGVWLNYTRNGGRHRENLGHEDVARAIRAALDVASQLRAAHEEAERASFWQRVEVGPGCWEWDGPTKGGGYGYLSVRGSTRYAHRMAWRYAFGPIPEQEPRLSVCHHCDNPSCCRPDHLFLGTQSDNLLDASRKGRLPHANFRHNAPRPLMEVGW